MKGFNPMAAQQDGDAPNMHRALIISADASKGNALTKALAGFGFIFVGLYYIIAILLCCTCIGAIIGIPMLIGATAFQAALALHIVGGVKYVLQCPRCMGTVNKYIFTKQGGTFFPCNFCKQNIKYVEPNVFISYIAPVNTLP